MPRPAQLIRLPFSDFSPDLDSLTKGSVRDMLGFYPTQKGYRTLPGLTPILTPFNGKVVGSHAVGSQDPNNPIVAATYSRLAMSLNGGPWVFATIPFTNTANRWRFDNYGPDLIGVNGIDPPVVSTSDAPFANLGGNPPIFSLIQATDNAVIGVVANSQEWFSTLVDTNWTPDITTETIQAFITSTPGNIIAAVQLRGNVAFFKNKALHYAQFAGPPFFWNVAAISHQVGTWSQEAVINARDVLYFWGTDDFYTFDGYSLLPITNNLREFIFRDLDLAHAQNIAGYYDDVNGPIVKWHYPSTSANPPGTLDSYVCLNIRFGTWGWGRQSIDYPLLGAVTYGTQGDIAGLFLQDHGLRLFDSNAALASPFITCNDLGDGHYLYQVNRIRPRFQLYPSQAPLPVPTVGEDVGPFAPYPTPGPSFGTIDCQQLYAYVMGRPLQPGIKQTIDQDGWFNQVMTNRIQRFQIIVHDPCEIVELELSVQQAGEV